MHAQTTLFYLRILLPRPLTPLASPPDALARRVERPPPPFLLDAASPSLECRILRHIRLLLPATAHQRDADGLPRPHSFHRTAHARSAFSLFNRRRRLFHHKGDLPLLPPNLQHLTLRPDLSHAHLPFPLDESILPHGLTFAESKDMAQYRMNARMDVSYMFQAALSLLDLATTTTSFRSLSVWQPADPGLSWFDGQIQDFATTCRNKNVTGRLLEPMLLRWKNGAEHWDLVREITLFESESEEEEELLSEARANVLRERFWRGEGRLGQVLGLGCQFHVDALCKGRVTAIRRPDTARHGMNRLC
jgi:hypothetical protein